MTSVYRDAARREGGLLAGPANTQITVAKVAQSEFARGVGGWQVAERKHPWPLQRFREKFVLVMSP